MEQMPAAFPPAWTLTRQAEILSRRAGDFPEPPEIGESEKGLMPCWSDLEASDRPAYCDEISVPDQIDGSFLCGWLVWGFKPLKIPKACISTQAAKRQRSYRSAQGTQGCLQTIHLARRKEAPLQYAALMTTNY